MQGQPQNFHIFSPGKTFKDDDVEHLKFLIDRALVPNQSKTQEIHQGREQEYLKIISTLQGRITELTTKIDQIEKKYVRVQHDLQNEKQMRRREASQNQRKIRQLQNEREDWNNHKQLRKTSVPDKNMNSSLSHRSPSPSNIKSSYFKRTQTPINDLLEFSFHQTEPNRDQIHRLHSYLLENTTTLKLLLEKQKYLIKIREMGRPSQSQENQVIQKTQRVTEDRRIEEQAKSMLSKKGYYDEDRSLSDIQNQNNFISSQ